MNNICIESPLGLNIAFPRTGSNNGANAANARISPAPSTIDLRHPALELRAHQI